MIGAAFEIFDSGLFRRKKFMKIIIWFSPGAGLSVDYILLKYIHGWEWAFSKSIW